MSSHSAARRRRAAGTNTSSDQRLLAGKLFPLQRQEVIAARLSITGGVRVADVVERFGVSVATARRDLNATVQAGVGVRVYGGIVLGDGRARPTAHP